MNSNLRLILALAALPAASHGNPVPVTGTMTYSQNFDSLGTGSPAWTDDSTIPGWYAQINSGNTASGNLQAAYGSTVLSGLLNLGAAGGADRALGSKATGTGNLANISYGVLFQNTGTKPVALSQLNYIGELWRTNAGIGTPLVAVNEEYSVFYQVSNTPVSNIVSGATSATAAAGAGFTALWRADWVSPVNSPLGTELDGNLDANRQSVSVDQAGVNVLPGQYLMLKWTDANEAGTDGFQGIDNVSIQFTELNGVLSPAVSDITRSSNGTSGNPADDTFGFTVSVAGSGTSIGTGWTTNSVSAPNATSAPYGVPVVWTGFPWPGSKTVVFADNNMPSFTATISVDPPRLIGTNELTGENVLTAFTPPAQWVIDEALQTITMNNGGGAPAKTITSAPVDLSTVSGHVRFSAMLGIVDSSSGFETDDTFLAQLILNDGVGSITINLIAPHDTDGSGVLQGVELADIMESKTLPLSYIISDNIVSAQLIISGANSSMSETTTVSGILFEMAPPTLTASAATNIVRNENGPGVADDTVSFDTVISGANAGPGWSATGGASPLSGPYGPVTITVPAGAASVTLRFTDVTYPAAAQDLTIAVPPRYVIGTQYYGGSVLELATALDTPPAPAWTNDPVARALDMTTGGTSDKIVASDVIDLSTIGSVDFSAAFLARETSTGSNFETTDRFKAELVINGGTAGEQIVNLVTAWDSGDGASNVPAAPNGAPNGYMNGYQGTVGAAPLDTALLEYNDQKARDEFNRTGANGDAQIENIFALNYTIPASANSVQLRIYGAGISGSEFFTVSNVLFTSVPSTQDSDSDGTADLHEIADGTDPHNPASIFNIASVTRQPGNPGTVLAAFPTVSGRIYRGYYSNDLAAWTRDDAHPLVTGDGTAQSWPLVPSPSPGTRLYLRVIVGRTATDFPPTLP